MPAKTHTLSSARYEVEYITGTPTGAAHSCTNFDEADSLDEAIERVEELRELDHVDAVLQINDRKTGARLRP